MKESESFKRSLITLEMIAPDDRRKSRAPFVRRMFCKIAHILRNSERMLEQTFVMLLAQRCSVSLPGKLRRTCDLESPPNCIKKTAQSGLRFMLPHEAYSEICDACKMQNSLASE